MDENENEEIEDFGIEAEILDAEINILAWNI